MEGRDRHELIAFLRARTFKGPILLNPRGILGRCCYSRLEVMAPEEQQTAFAASST